MDNTIDMQNVSKYIYNSFGASAQIPSTYYHEVSKWEDWYKGYVESFHKLTINNNAVITTRNRASLKFGYKLCSDWGSLLLSEDVKISIDDGSKCSGANKSSIFIQGTDGNDGGVLGSTKFWSKIHTSVQEMFGLGTMAIIPNLLGIEVSENGDIIRADNGSIDLVYTNAKYMLPISGSNGVIRECAFAYPIIQNNKRYLMIQAHMLEADGYVIYNTVLDGENDVGTLFPNLCPKIKLPRFSPIFVTASPALSNTVDFNSLLGMSILENNIDALKALDITYDSFSSAFVTGQTLIFMPSDLYGVDETTGKPISPQDGRQSYMQIVDRDFVGGTETTIKDKVWSFSPELRVDDHDKAIQRHLDTISLLSGLGPKYYQSNGSVISTATQFVGERNELVRNIHKHSAILEDMIRDLVLNLLWLAKNVLKKNVSDTCKVTVNLSDGVIEDDNTARANDKADMALGIMSRLEYRMKWYNETEEVARQKIKMTDDDIKSQSNSNVNETKTDKVDNTDVSSTVSE